MSSGGLHYAGIIPLISTPFHEDESLDLESLEGLIKFNVEIGADAIAVLGVLGEANRLTDAERARVIAASRTAAGSLPVVAGTGHAGTAATVDLSRAAIELGATAVMIAPPLQPIPSDKVVLEYFANIAKKVSAPIVLQDYPPMSQVHMSVDLIVRLVLEIPNIVAIKAEAVPSPQKVLALKRTILNTRPVAIVTGLGALYALYDLECGSDGFNTGFAFPEVLRAILLEFQQGNAQQARDLFERYLPLIVFEQQPGVAIRKEILRRRGLLMSNRVRHPGATIDAATAEQVARLLDATFGNTDITKPLRIQP